MPSVRSSLSPEVSALSWKIARYGSSSCKCYLQHLQVPQRTTANEEAIASLAPQVKALAKMLCKPVSESDVEERERRGELER